jgi:hypothetical protein
MLDESGDRMMSAPTLEQAFHDARQLPMAGRQSLVELQKPPKTI